MRIDMAYCVELGRVVDIQTACREFTSQNKVSEFHFLCSDETCRKSREGGVRVIGVNHYQEPEVGKVYKSPHYRRKDHHIPSCFWMELDAVLDEEISSGEEKFPDKDLFENLSIEHRKMLRKNTHLVTRFILPPVDTVALAFDGISAEMKRIRDIDNPLIRKKALVAYASGIGATATNLAALVSCFEELKEMGALDFKFRIDGVGIRSFREVFRHVAMGPKADFTIFYGGAWLAKRYGANRSGFLLSFMDRLNDSPIRLYVSPETMKKYFHRDHLVRLIDEVEKTSSRKPYLKVYWIGRQERNEERNQYDASYSNSMAYVVMRIAYPGESGEKANVSRE